MDVIPSVSSASWRFLCDRWLSALAVISCIRIVFLCNRWLWWGSVVLILRTRIIWYWRYLPCSLYQTCLVCDIHRRHEMQLSPIANKLCILMHLTVDRCRNEFMLHWNKLYINCKSLNGLKCDIITLYHIARDWDPPMRGVTDQINRPKWDEFGTAL